MKLLYGWPEPCVQSVCMVCMAGTSPSVQSKTVCIYTVLADPGLLWRDGVGLE